MVYCGLRTRGSSSACSARRERGWAVGLGRAHLRGQTQGQGQSVEDGKVKVLRGDHTGTVERVNTELLTLLLDNGYLPILTPPGSSYEGVAVNVDGDRAAAALAVAFQAEALLLLSNVPGLLRNFPDESSLIAEIPAGEVETYLAFAQGRMKKKVLGAAEAVQGGVKRVVFGDARFARPVSAVLAGRGTVVR
jgi:acetylglutamate/LysW-gamma-L-alpha-aminoadipate kinase